LSVRSLTTPAILPIGESHRLNRLRHACLIVPPGLWLAAALVSALDSLPVSPGALFSSLDALFSLAASVAATMVAGMALAGASLLLRGICRRLDPQGKALVIVEDDGALPAAVSRSTRSARAGESDNRGCGDAKVLFAVRIAADLSSAFWLIPAATPTRRPALLLCRDALGEGQWRALRQRLALGATLWLAEGGALPPGISTVSRPVASVSG